MSEMAYLWRAASRAENGRGREREGWRELVGSLMKLPEVTGDRVFVSMS